MSWKALLDQHLTRDLTERVRQREGGRAGGTQGMTGGLMREVPAGGGGDIGTPWASEVVERWGKGDRETRPITAGASMDLTSTAL